MGCQRRQRQWLARVILYEAFSPKSTITFVPLPSFFEDSLLLICFGIHISSCCMSITILTNKTLRDDILILLFVTSILLCCFWPINNVILHDSVVFYDPCSLSSIIPIWFSWFVIHVTWLQSHVLTYNCYYHSVQRSFESNRF